MWSHMQTLPDASAKKKTFENILAKGYTSHDGQITLLAQRFQLYSKTVRL